MDERAEIESFISELEPGVADIVRAARATILAIIPEAIEQLDPADRLVAYGRDRSLRGMICALAVQRSYVNLMFAKGTQLPDPSDLLVGTGKSARHVRLSGPEDATKAEIIELLAAAADLTP